MFKCEAIYSTYCIGAEGGRARKRERQRRREREKEMGSKWESWQE